METTDLSVNFGTQASAWGGLTHQLLQHAFSHHMSSGKKTTPPPKIDECPHEKGPCEKLKVESSNHPCFRGYIGPSGE